MSEIGLAVFTGIDSDAHSLPYRVYGVISDIITEAAQAGSAIFIGRCAVKILRDARVRFRSVFIYSTDIQRKIARAIEQDGVPAKDAEKYIAKMDKTRARYQQFFTNTRFGDYRDYDLCLNSGRLGYEACVDMILTATAAGSPRAHTGQAKPHAAPTQPSAEG